MPKNFYLNNRNGVRSSRVDHLKSKQAIGAAPLHVRLTYSFRIEKSVSQRLSWALSHPEGAFFFSQKNTDEQNTQGFTETLSQPISQSLTANRSLTPSPSPNGEGSDYRDTPICPPYV